MAETQTCPNCGEPNQTDRPCCEACWREFEAELAAAHEEFLSGMEEPCQPHQPR